MALIAKVYSEINNHLDYFRISNSLNEDVYKRFSELSIFFEFTYPLCLDENEKLANALKNFIFLEIETLSDNKVFENIYVSYHIIVPYVSIRRYQKIEKLEKYVNLIIANKLFPLEAPPHRAMEWDYLLYKLDSNYKVPIPSSSILKQNFQLQYFDREMAYGLTHALFYLMDFGFSNHELPLENLHKLKFQLEALIIKFSEHEDVDLVLELGINYFSLLPFIEIDYSILKIIQYTLDKASFIEFDWNSDVLVKKYYSCFVLGILTALLNYYSNSEKLEKSKLNLLLSALQSTIFINFTDFKSPEYTHDFISSLSIVQSWEFLKKTRIKEFNVELYKKYVEQFDSHKFLTQSILGSLQFLKIRNEHEVLWSDEFEELNLDLIDRQRLKSDFQDKIEKDINYLQSLL